MAHSKDRMSRLKFSLSRIKRDDRLKNRKQVHLGLRIQSLRMGQVSAVEITEQSSNLSGPWI